MENFKIQKSNPVQRGRILAIIGAQYGSEGKGVVVNYLANDYKHHVRVGGPNAGHTIIHDGQLYKMQVIPCGWTNPHAKIYIGRGALVNVAQLKKELNWVRAIDPLFDQRFFIDYKAGVLDEKFALQEGHTTGELHQRIGSTGEGVGVARIARIQRNPNNFRFFHELPETEGLAQFCFDTVVTLNYYNRLGENILLEGAQGSALSLIHGSWPYVTSHDTNAAQLAADIGIAPQHITDVMLVARTYPIRVAGNSGYLHQEITWDKLSTKLGKHTQEQTTVTKKIRRIGEWDDSLIDRAVLLNAPTCMAMMFVDYLDPVDSGVDEYNNLSITTKNFIKYVENKWQVPITLIGTGGYEKDNKFHVVDRTKGVIHG